MRLISDGVRRFWAHEDGPTAVEYAVMLAMIVAVCFTAVWALGTSTNQNFSGVSTVLATPPPPER